MASRIIVVQPECINRTGHNYAALRSLESAIAPAKPIFCIHRNASRSLELAKDRTLRHFSGRIACESPLQDNASNVVTSSVRELSDLVERLAIGPDDHLVFLSASAETALALLQVLRDRDLDHWPHCHLRFFGDERRRDIEGIAHKMLSDIRGRNAKLHLYTEFAANVRHVVKFYEDNPFDLARLPTIWPDKVAPEDNQGKDKYFTIGVFGPPRRDKGKYRLAPIFAELFAEANAGKIHSPIRVLIQNNKSLHRAIRLRVSLAMRLRTNVRGVSFASAEMSNARFISLMRKCDVILLPYTHHIYVRRGSGIAVDAVAHGVPFVCTDRTAMCELIQSGNGLAASSDREFVDALLAIAGDLDRFKAGAREAAIDARQWWSDSIFLALRNVGSDASRTNGAE